jgi:hypothetical protein
MAVLVVGFFGLSFEPLTHSSIPGAIPYTTVYDSGAAQVVIKVPDSITEEALRATLRQAASNLFKASRLGGQPGQIPTIRARVLAHDSEGASRLVYLGQVQAVPNQETGEPLTIHVNRQALGQLSTQSDS